MKLVIRGRPFRSYSPHYRGTYRTVPHIRDDVPDEHPINRAFFRYLGEGDELGVIHDLDTATELVWSLNRNGASEVFELLEVTYLDEPSSTQGELLGYDLSAGFSYSLLSWGLEFDSVESGESDHSRVPRTVAILLRLIQTYFQPRLNASGLLDTASDARFCLECMMSLQEFSPGLFESPDIHFEVVGICLVPVNV